MRKILLLFLLTLGLLATPGYAVVINADLGLTTVSGENQINFQAKIESALNRTYNDSTTASGNMIVDLDYSFDPSDPHYPTLNTMAFTGGGFSLTDVHMGDNASIGIYSLRANADGVDMGGTFTTPSPPAPVTDSMYFNAEDHEAVINQGSMDMLVESKLLFGDWEPEYSQSMDFSQESLSGTSPGTGTITTTWQSQTGNDHTFKVRVELPMEIVEKDVTNVNILGDVTYTVTAEGMLVAEGTFTETILPPNTAPVADDDGYSEGEANYSVHIGDTLTITSPGVLEGDSDADWDSLTAQKFSDPTSGTVTLNSNGSFTYDPTDNRYNDGYRGTIGIDTFTYQANDGSAENALSNVATVSINVYNNDADASDDAYSVYQHGDLIVAYAIEGVLNDDSDGDADTFIAAIKDNVAHGDLTLNPDGTFTYTPDDSFFGTDSFTYYADDGWTALGDRNWATVEITVNEAIPGDANLDGKVDGSDVTILANNWQKGVGTSEAVDWGMGDFNLDGKVDGSDVTILANNWQEGVNTVGAAVPEPGTFVLLLSALLGLALIRRKR